MMKPYTIKFGVSGNSLFTAGKTICEFNDSKTAEDVHDFMAKMYIDAKQHGAASAMIIGGAAAIITGLVLKSIWYVQSI